MEATESRSSRLGDFLVKAKVRYARGQHWYGYVNDVVPILLLIGVYQIDFSWFFLLMLIYAASLIVIGIVDFYKGIWLKEARYATLECNPAFDEMFKRIKEIHESFIKEKDKK